MDGQDRLLVSLLGRGGRGERGKKRGRKGQCCKPCIRESKIEPKGSIESSFFFFGKKKGCIILSVLEFSEFF